MDDSEKHFYRNLIQSWKDYIVEYHCVLLLWKGFSVNDVVEVTGLDSRVVRQYHRKILAIGTLTDRMDGIVGPRKCGTKPSYYGTCVDKTSGIKPQESQNGTLGMLGSGLAECVGGW